MKKDGVKSSDLQTLMTEVKPYLDDACYRLAWDFVKNRQLTFKEAMEFIGFVSFLTRSLRQYSQEDVERLEEDNDDLKDEIDDLEIQTCNLEGENEELEEEIEKLKDENDKLLAKNERLFSAIDEAGAALIKGDTYKAFTILRDAE